MKSVAALGLFAVIMASAAIFTMNQPAFADPAEPEEPNCTIFFDPQKPDVKVDELFTVTVLVDDVNNLWGYEIGLKFEWGNGYNLRVSNTIKNRIKLGTEILGEGGNKYL